MVISLQCSRNIQQGPQINVKFEICVEKKNLKSARKYPAWNLDFQYVYQLGSGTDQIWKKLNE